MLHTRDTVDIKIYDTSDAQETKMIKNYHRINWEEGGENVTRLLEHDLGQKSRAGLEFF